MFARGAADEGAPGHAPAHTADLTALLRTCLVALRVPEDIRAYLPQPPSLWRVSDATARIEQMLDVRPEGGLLAVFLPRIDGKAAPRELRCRAALASTLVVGLELARGGSLTLEQEGAWTPIQIRHGSV